MRVEKLIQELEKLPIGTEVCIFDWQQNAYNASGDPDDTNNGIGIHDKFVVDYMKEGVNIPFIALRFENDDYTYMGEPNYGSAFVCALAEKEA